MAAHDMAESGIIFKVAVDGTVSIGGYAVSPSHEMRTRIQPLIEKVAPKVREYFEEELKKELEKRTEVC